MTEIEEGDSGRKNKGSLKQARKIKNLLLIYNVNKIF